MFGFWIQSRASRFCKRNVLLWYRSLKHQFHATHCENKEPRYWYNHSLMCWDGNRDKSIQYSPTREANSLSASQFIFVYIRTLSVTLDSSVKLWTDGKYWIGKIRKETVVNQLSTASTSPSDAWRDRKTTRQPSWWSVPLRNSKCGNPEHMSEALPLVPPRSVEHIQEIPSIACDTKVHDHVLKCSHYSLASATFSQICFKLNFVWCGFTKETGERVTQV